MEKHPHIMHIDLDAFFASVEQRDNPDLRGKPVIIGGQPGQRGVVSTCSYEARRFGIRSAMPLTEAYRRCPQGIFLPGRMAVYVEVSRQIHEIFRRFTPIVEAVSIDEAYLDLKGCTRLFGEPLEIGRKIKEAVTHETGLTASVGIAENKFLAKIASELEKPDGLVLIEPQQAQRILNKLPIEKLHGVGPKTTAKLAALSIRTVEQLARTDPTHLSSHLGKTAAEHLYNLSRGIDNRPVTVGEEAKSMGHEHTFLEDTASIPTIESTLLHMAEKVGRRLRKDKVVARTIALKLRYHDFNTLTRHTTLREPTSLDQGIYQAAKELFHQTYSGHPVRLLGITAMNLQREGQVPQQMSLFGSSQEREQKLANALDNIKDRYGDRSITYAKVKEKEED